MKEYIKSIISLTVICAVVVALLALTNSVTGPIIEKNQASAANEALLVVMPEGKEFTQVDLSAYTLPETVLEAYSETSGGYVFKLSVSGYGPDMIIMCGVGADGAVTGATCLSSNETLGQEKTFGETTVGSTAETIESLATVSGATMTTGAYKNAVKDAINSAIILGGGSVDIRTPEQILADNLAAALPAGEGKFTSLFICEVLENVSAVYAADNNAGFVFVTKSGEEDLFVGVDASGAVVSDVPADVKTNIENAAKIMAASKLTEIDLSSYNGIHENVDKISKTESGNYVIEVHSSGWGMGIGDEAQYDPNLSNEPIYIKVAMTKDGKIINCLTVKQAETEGLGSVCGNPEFYTQYNGKDETNYKDIAISGATFTTKGYRNGIGRAFEAVKILEGVA